MASLSNIKTVARYEAKTLRRSWFFRLFSIGSLFIIILMDIGMFSPVGNEGWEVISIPSSLPLINLYLLNIAQAIVVIFLAADFLKRDKKLDTNEVLYTRSMSNFEYVIGKSWGILRLFLSLNLLILAICLVINIISKSMSVNITSYFYYLLIISLPTIIFSLGLSFTLMSLLKNQAVTFLILLGYAALDIFYLYFRAGSIFDYMAFGLPLFKSGIIGFDNLSVIINQRLIYLFLGLSLIMATILLFKRLPQSRVHRVLTIILLFVFMTGSLICSLNTYSTYRKGLTDKRLVIETNREFENKKFASITDASLEFIHKGNSFEATADLKISNDNNDPISQYYFSLNPSLIVTKISSHGIDLNFKRINHIIEINPGKLLNPGDSDKVEFVYSGSINESFCYPNYSDNIKENPYKISMVNVNKRQAFLTENYVLLTPETHWYPVAGLNYYPSNPAQIKIDFTNYSLKVKSENNLLPVSQGKMSKENGYYIFKPESPLTGLTLAIGNYQTDKIKVDSVEYISYHFPGNDYYKKDLEAIKDTLPLLISGLMKDLESNFSTKYPFKTLSMLEVPVQFHSYPKESTQTRAEVQPSMVLLPERLSTLNQAGFFKQFKQQKKRMTRNGQVITDKELEVRIFNSFMRSTFISGENFRFIIGVAANEPTRYLLGPSFYFFKNNFYSSEYPVINAIFESHLQKVNSPGMSGFQAMSGTLSENDRANLILKNLSFKDLLAKNPKGDTLKTVLTIKGDYFFNLIRSKTGIDEFKDWFVKYIDDHRFKRVDILKFNNEIKNKFGFEFYPYLSDWFNGKEQPGFLFTNLVANEIVINERSRYQVTFVASNQEATGGLFNISFRTGGGRGTGGGGRGGGGFGGGGFGGGGGTFQVAVQGRGQISVQGRGMEAADISKIVYLGPHETKTVGIVLDAQPRAMMINTLFAKNIPGEITLPIDEIIKSKDVIREFSGEDIISSDPAATDQFSIIVDNEDAGFKVSKQNTENRLKKLLGIQKKKGTSYQQVSLMNIPSYWQPVVQSAFYGKYIRSAVYAKSGKGDKTLTWITSIDKPGYYDIFCFIGKTADRMMIRAGGFGGGARTGGAQGPGGAGGQGREGGGPPFQPYKEFHYRIYHDGGSEEISLEYENAENGWNKLGTYYLKADTAKVVLSNLSTGRAVIGDAIKWIRQK
jgi:ABC-type transport system involved in multi-copper enzyme maturation permease subunit/uncharacterized membrane protein YgcG